MRKSEREELVLKPGRGWSWAIEMPDGSFGLCNWADPGKADQMWDKKPSPEAKRVYVAIVPMKEYRKLMKAK